MRDIKKSVKYMVNDSERWNNFSNDRLAECIELCVDIRNIPTDEKIDKLNEFQLIRHKELDENKKRKFRMAIKTYKPGDELLGTVFSDIRSSENPTLKQVQEAVIILNSLYNTTLFVLLYFSKLQVTKLVVVNCILNSPKRALEHPQQIS